MALLNSQRYPSSEGNSRLPCNEDSTPESSSEGNGKVPTSVDTSFESNQENESVYGSEGREAEERFSVKNGVARKLPDHITSLSSTNLTCNQPLSHRSRFECSSW